MHTLAIVGSIGLDDIETPFGKKENLLGGAGSYAAVAASFFSQPYLIGVVGEDIPHEHLEFLQLRKINIDGLEKKGKTFRWQGMYEYDMNVAKTLKTELNNFQEYKPKVPSHSKNADIVFLTNNAPEVQRAALEQFTKPKLIVMDTMNFWIQQDKDAVLEMIKNVDILVVNDQEARMLFDSTNLYAAAQKALSHGLKAVIIKKGEHGALLFTPQFHFSLGGYPLEDVFDPTGCGDCFGGAFAGYLAKHGISSENLKKSVVYGSVIASFNAQDFSCDKLKEISTEDIECRFKGFKEMHEF